MYSTAIQIYIAVLKIAALFHPKARKWVEGRKNLIDRLRIEIPALIGERPVAWFHAASLGEFEQGRPVIEEFRKHFPDYFILLTFFSPSGYENRHNYTGADYICYLPADTKANATAFVDIFKPGIAFFIKYEFWHNYLSELKKTPCVVVSFSAIFRKEQLFFKWYGGSYRHTLRLFDHLFVQNEESVGLLAGIAVNNVTCNGDTRFDRVMELAERRRELPEIASFVAGAPCLVVGSAWEEDMQKVVIPYLNGLPESRRLKIIVAPHEISEATIRKWSSQLKLNALTYSAYQKSGFSDHQAHSTDCLFIDNIGMLSSLYQYASAAYIGGAFGKGLHNILEAATYGIPVYFGTDKYKKFQEAVDMIALGAAVSVQDHEDFRRSFDTLLDNNDLLRQKGALAFRYIQEHTGAVPPVIEFARAKLS